MEKDRLNLKHALLVDFMSTAMLATTAMKDGEVVTVSLKHRSL
ncbi:hypothetical protein [Rhodoferax sp.]|nr:hypothetical protein [Rhodoferax sp.]MDO9197271.1 hypothetical protein [Rhodoferax sp.]